MDKENKITSHMLAEVKPNKSTDLTNIIVVKYNYSSSIFHFITLILNYLFRFRLT